MNGVVVLDVFLILVCSLLLFPRAPHHQWRKRTKDDGSAVPGIRALSLMRQGRVQLSSLCVDTHPQRDYNDDDDDDDHPCWTKDVVRWSCGCQGCQLVVTELLVINFPLLNWLLLPDCC